MAFWDNLFTIHAPSGVNNVIIRDDNNITDDDISNFEFHSNKKRKRNSLQPVKSPATVVRNAFELLMNTDLTKTPANSKQLSNHKTVKINTTTLQTKPTAKVRLPPIRVQATFKDPKHTMEAMTAGSSEPVSFKIHQNGIHILTKCEDDFNAIKQKLYASKTPFFTYTLKKERSTKIVLKGFHNSFSPLEVKEALIANNVPVIEVFPMFKKGRIPIDMFLVILSQSAKINEITSSIKCVLNQPIQWEAFERRNIGTQCRKCQQFGHAASNCGMEYRCVKCTHKHNPNECLLEDNSLACCVNCKENHTANDRNCKVYKEYVSKIKKNVSNSCYHKIKT